MSDHSDDYDMQTNGQVDGSVGEHDNPAPIEADKEDELQKILWELMGEESSLFMSRKERGVDIVMPVEQLTELGLKAKTAIEALITDRVVAARIDELAKINRNYRIGGAWTGPDKRYGKGRNDQINEIMKITHDRIQELTKTDRQKIKEKL